MAKALADIRLVSSWRAILKKNKKNTRITREARDKGSSFASATGNEELQPPHRSHVPDEVEDEALQGAQMGAGELVDDRVDSPHRLLPLLQACREHNSLVTGTAGGLIAAPATSKTSPSHGGCSKGSPPPHSSLSRFSLPSSHLARSQTHSFFIYFFLKGLFLRAGSCKAYCTAKNNMFLLLSPV